MRSYSRNRKKARNNISPSPLPLPLPLPSPSPSPSVSPSPSPPPLPKPDISSGDEETDDKKRLGTLLDLDLLNCPVCFEAFTDVVFQCDNGHLACSSCCTKLRNKCYPSCTLPIGNIRCRAMENMVESITVSCRNSSFGCSEIFCYKDEKIHEKKCLFSPCSCPLLDCNYTGHYKDLYQHFDSTHKSDFDRYCSYVCDTTVDVWMHVSQNIYVLNEIKERLLFVVQRFRDENGEYVNVSCVAPLGVDLDKFSYHLSISCRYTITFESPDIQKIQEVEFERPEENFMSIPRFFNGPMKMKLLIRKRNSK